MSVAGVYLGAQALILMGFFQIGLRLEWRRAIHHIFSVYLYRKQAIGRQASEDSC